MSYYAWDSKMSYKNYLAANDVAKEISMEISHQTREIVASTKALVSENIRVMETSKDQVTETLSDGFDRISYEFKDISAGTSELDGAFHWGFSQLIAGIGRMSDSLSELKEISKIPARTKAYEQYDIARDAFRQGLYPECLESLEKAINGDHTSPGYKLEWRFYQMRGVVFLGFFGCDLSLVDLELAIESFLLAARYARKDFPEHAAHAFLSAGWAAYCQGKMKIALNYTKEAISLNRRLGEAIFQAAKILMASGVVKKALPLLGKAIEIDRFYALKAAGDGDFKKHGESLINFLKTLRPKIYDQATTQIQATMEKLRFYRVHFKEAKQDTYLKRMEELFSDGKRWPLFDVLAVTQPVNVELSKTQERMDGKIKVVAVEIPGVTRSCEKTVKVEEAYEEDVVIKQKGLFSKEVVERKTKTRTVEKVRRVSRNLTDIRYDFYTWQGKAMCLEFCRIPAGEFMMGEKKDRHKEIIYKDFYIGKYPVTQGQWETVMGENPSVFKGNPDLPVENITYKDCYGLIVALNEIVGVWNFSLPTEEEWEYSCRAGSSGEDCFTDDVNARLRKQGLIYEDALLDEHAWYKKNSNKQTHPVGTKKPNAWGLYDMHGNVFEWCQSSVEGAVRGGSWYVPAFCCKCAFRSNNEPDTRRSDTGFRLALNIDQ